MDVKELADILDTMVGSAPSAYKTTMLLLFGVQYAQEIDGRAREIVEAAGFLSRKAMYTREVCRGMRLAPYVTVKDATR